MSTSMRTLGSSLLLSLAASNVLLSVSALDASQHDGNAFNDPLQLNPPALPTPLPPLAFDLPLASKPAGLGVVQDSILGFSIELSVTNQVFGKTVSSLSPVFVKLLDQVSKRAGHVKVRVGGNSQENSELVTVLADGAIIEKSEGTAETTTGTPDIKFSRDLIKMMQMTSMKTNVGWYLGIPFNDTNFRLGVAEAGQELLGDNLLGLQLGNEPDLYGRHGRRDENTWTPKQYFSEFGQGLKAINENPKIPVKNKIIGPSIALSEWSPEQVWETGFIDTYKNSLGALSVERYPASNCGSAKGLGKVVQPQEQLTTLMSHQAAQDYVGPYLHSSALALEAGKPFVVMEFNTGTCSGFPGMSNSFASALWIVDAALQMAHANFSGAMLHVGGQDAFYNPFTAPPGAEAKIHSWTAGPSYYATLAVAEALGNTNKSRVIDLFANGANPYTPAYGVYEDGTEGAQRAVLLNFMTDASGKADYTASIQVPASTSSVKVKYLRAGSTAAKTGVTWAGQTLGETFQVTGDLRGDLDVQTVACNGGKCAVKVPAPAAAIVFMNDKAFAASNPVVAASGSGSSAAPSASTTDKVAAGKGKTTGSGSGSGTDAEGAAVGLRAALGFVAAVVIGTVVNIL